MRTSSILFPLSALLLLTACGYTPLYAPVAGQAGLPMAIGVVEMASVKTEPGQRLVAQEVRQRLVQSFPASLTETYTASLSITETTTELALRSTAALERAQIALTGTLVVRDAAGKEHLSTSLATTAAYNVENNPFSTESGKAFARQVAARNLADAVARRLALFARTGVK